MVLNIAQNRKNLIVLVLAACIVAFPYGMWQGWWKFIPSTAALLLLSWAAHGRSSLEKVGLAGSCREYRQAAMVFPLATAVGVGLIFFVAEMSFLTVLWPPSVLYFLMPLFQVINEEILFRALLLSALLKIIPKVWGAIVGAFLFTMMHGVLYIFIEQALPSPLAFGTLFMFGATVNYFYIMKRNILKRFKNIQNF